MNGNQESCLYSCGRDTAAASADGASHAAVPGAEHGGSSAADVELLARRWIVSDELAVESDDEAYVIVVNRASAQRLKLSRTLYRFLQSFDVPRRIEEVAVVGPSGHLLSQVRKLRDRRILVDADAPSAAASLRLRAAVAYKFCNAPRYVSSSAAADFVVLGVPYDFGAAGDCRASPAAIRQKSLDYTYEMHFETRRPRGWFDVNRGARILEGASIADAGDVHVEYGENQRDTFARVDHALGEVCTGGTIPLILGGDGSITHAVVDHLCRRRALTVVQFAATPAIADGGGAGITASTVGRRIAQMTNVAQFISLGASDAGMNATAGSAKLNGKAGHELRQAPPARVIEQLKIESEVHLSIDSSVLTAAYAKPNRAELAPGLTLHEMKELIRALGVAHRIVGIDLVGLDMQLEPPGVATVAACHLVLAAMSAAYDRS